MSITNSATTAPASAAAAVSATADGSVLASTSTTPVSVDKLNLHSSGLAAFDLATNADQRILCVLREQQKSELMLRTLTVTHNAYRC